MQINGHWETIDNLEDVAKVVREYYNPELADKMYELIEAVNCKIEDLEYKIDDLSFQIDELEYEIEDLKYSQEDEE